MANRSFNLNDAFEFKIVTPGYNTLYFEKYIEATVCWDHILRNGRYKNVDDILKGLPGKVPDKMSMWYYDGKSWRLAYRLV